MARPAEYDPVSHTIRLDTRGIGGCLSHECVEGVLLHELGHACLHSRRFAMTSPSQRVGLGTREVEDYGRRWNSSPSTNLSHLQAVLPPRTFRCLQGAHITPLLQRAAEALAWSADEPEAVPKVHAQLEELFADSVFSAQLISPAHWGFACSANHADESHGALARYARCFFEDRPSLIQSLCH